VENRSQRRFDAALRHHREESLSPRCCRGTENAFKLPMPASTAARHREMAAPYAMIVLSYHDA
jgi:hypothetical protein